MEYVRLAPVDAADVTIIMDNSIDALMASSPQAQRTPMAWNYFDHEQLRAEHGRSSQSSRAR